MSLVKDFVEAIIRASGMVGTHRKLVAQGGTLIIDDTGAHTGLEGLSIMAQSATVISACTGKNAVGGTVDFKATYNWVTLAAGVPIIAPDNFRITAITLTSGSIAVYS